MLLEIAPQQLPRLRLRPDVEAIRAGGKVCVGNDMTLRKLPERESLRLTLGRGFKHEVVAQACQSVALRVEVRRVNFVGSGLPGVDIELDRAALREADGVHSGLACNGIDRDLLFDLRRQCERDLYRGR